MPNNPLYGFVDLEHLWDERVTTVGEQVVSNAIVQSVEEHNRQMDSLLSLFVDPTTEFQIRVQSAALTRNQPLDDYGRARPIQPGGFYKVAFPLQQSGNAWGANWRTRVKLTVGEANRITQTLLDGDIRWMRDHVLAALFFDTNPGWTFNDPAHDAIVIKGLANGDTDEYLVQVGADSGATDDHYLAQVAAVADSDDPFPAYYDDLIEHPENGGEVIALIPTNQKTATEGLAEFTEVSDPNIRLGSGLSEYIGTPGVPIPGRLIGYHGAGVHIVHWKSMPANYIVCVTSEGDRALNMRREPEAELQGFKLAAIREDHPYWDAQYLRFAGFGARNRVGALVGRIGNASYAIPTNYTSPMS